MLGAKFDLGLGLMAIKVVVLPHIIIVAVYQPQL